MIDSQLRQVMTPACSVFHGLNTVDYFRDFSVDHVISELRIKAPDAFHLFCQLGNCDRVDSPESSHDLHVKCVSSLTTLLKCRSIKVLGVQLLLTFMLIAQATSKQVGCK